MSEGGINGEIKGGNMPTSEQAEDRGSAGTGERVEVRGGKSGGEGRQFWEGRYGSLGFKPPEHPELPGTFVTPEGKIAEKEFGELKKQYLATLDGEADKLERRKPLPYDNWRVLGLFDFLEEIPTKEPPEGLSDEAKEEFLQRLEDLSMELKRHFEMREAIWNRICWHKKSLGFLLNIVSQDSPRPGPEQLRAFEALPETREALGIFLSEIAPFYTQAHCSSTASVRELYQAWENLLLEKIPTLGREKASQIIRKVEDYLEFMGYISILDPKMDRRINDNINEAAFGGTRNRERIDGRRPAGPPYGAALFVDRALKPEDLDAMAKFKRNPLILLEGENKFEPQYIGSFYHQTTVEGTILKGRLEDGQFVKDENGKFCFVMESGKLVIKNKKVASEKQTLGLSLNEIKIRGKNISEEEVRKWLETNKELKLKVRLIDLMGGGKKLLPLEIWNFLPEDPFGGMLLGWLQVGVQAEARGFYGLTLKDKWELREIDNYPALAALYHQVRYLMNASPLLNVLDEAGFVKINNKGEIGFGEKFNGFTRREMHELVLARLIALAASTLSPSTTWRLSPTAEEPVYVQKLREGMLNSPLVDYIIRVATESFFVGTEGDVSTFVKKTMRRYAQDLLQIRTEPILTQEKAIKELRSRLVRLA